MSATFTHWSHLPDSVQLHIHTFCDITTTIQLAQTDKYHKQLLEPYLPKYLHCRACNSQLCHSAHIDHAASNGTGAVCIRLNSPQVVDSDVLRCGTCKLYVGCKLDTGLLQLNTHLMHAASHSSGQKTVTSCLTFIRRKLFSKTVKRKLLFDDIDVTQKLQRLQFNTHNTSDSTSVYTLAMQYIVVRNTMLAAVQSCRQSSQPVTCRYCSHTIARGSDVLDDDTHMIKYIAKHGILVNAVDSASVLHSADRTPANVAGVLQYSTMDVFCADCKHYVGVQVCPDSTCDRLIHMQGRYILHTSCIDYSASIHKSVMSTTLPNSPAETSERWSRSESMSSEEPSITNMDIECRQNGSKLAEKIDLTAMDSEDEQMSESMLVKYLAEQ